MPDQPDLLRSLLTHTWAWTAEANGVGLGPEEEASERPHEWNRAYFSALANVAVSDGIAGIERTLLPRINQLPDERFFGAVEAALYRLDVDWLDRGSASTELVLAARMGLADRLVTTRDWRRLSEQPSSRIGLELGGAVAALFLGQHPIGQAPTCYVAPAGMARAAALLPKLTELVEQAAGSTFVAMAFLSLLEVEPHRDRLEFLARGLVAWWKVRGPDAEFWLEYGIGRRVCEWIEKALFGNGEGGESSSLAPDADVRWSTMLDILIRCGVPATAALHERMRRCDE